MKNQRYAPHIVVSILAILAILAGIRIAPKSVYSKTGLQTQEPVSLSLGFARRGHTATALADGRVIVIGGQNQSGPISEAEVIDPGQETVSVVAALRTARFHHTSTRLSDGRVLVIGGSDLKGALRTTEIFDPQTNKFQEGPRLRLARTGHSATRLKDGRLLIAGGRSDGSAEIFDENTGRFTQVKAKMNGPRSLHGAVLLKNGNVLIAGGVSPDGQALDNAEIFKPHDEGFYPVSTWMYAARVRPDMRVLPDGKVQIIGGDRKGTMEMYDLFGNFFRGVADVTSVASSLPIPGLLQAQTRAAFIDHDKSRDEQETAQMPEAQAAQENRAAVDNSLFRAEYASAEIPQLNLAVIAGGVDDKDKVMQSVMLVKSVPAFVTTNKVDYPPEVTPVIRGGGWQSGENIVIHRLEVKTGQMTSLRTIADKDGNIAYSGLSPADHQVSNYMLTAVGESSGYVAQTIYRSAPALDLKKAGKPPQRIKFNIPLSGGSQGVVQTYDGPYHYKITRPKSNVPGGSVQPTAKLNFGPFNESWSGVGVTFPAPLPPLGWHTSGNLHLDGYLEVTVDIDFGQVPNPICCACEAACELFDCDCTDACSFGSCAGRLPDLKASLKFVANFNASINNDFELAGTVLNRTSIPVFPLIELDIPPSPETGDPLGFKLTIGLLGGIQLSFDKVMKFKTCLSFGADTTTTISAGVTSGLTSSFTAAHQHSSSGFEMVELGSTCFQLSLGPGISGKIYTEDCDPLIEMTGRPVAGFIDGCLSANTVDPNCQLYNVSILGGLKADFRIPIGCGAITVPLVSLEHEYFKENIASFDVGVFKDLLGPVITAPSDFTQAADTGQCSAVVSYASSATDYCSGVKSFSCSPPSGSVFPKGITTVTCTAVDNAGRQFACTNPSFNGNVSTHTFKVTVMDSELPKFTSSCPGDIAKFTDPGKCSAVTTFTPPTASDNCPGVVVTCTPASGTAFVKGVTTVTCKAEDTSGNNVTCSFKVTVTDNEPPVITGESPSPSVLWSPNHQMVDIMVNYTSSDNCGADCRLTAVSNEPDDGLGDGDTAHDIEIIDAHRLRLRSERSGLGNGRIYTITITCVDDTGNPTTKTVTVTVPKSQR